MKPTAVSSNVAYLSGDASPARITERLRQPGSDATTHHHRPAPPVQLTRRQMEVFSLLCEGLPNKLISRQLNIAKGTVKVHISFILRQLGVSSRLQAVVAAQRCGLLGEFGTGDRIHAGGTSLDC